MRPDGVSERDLAALAALSDEDVERGAREDPDAQPWTEDHLARAAFGRDVRRLRRSLGMTQDAFASALTVPVATLRNWEQARVNPDPAARALIRIVMAAPEAALRALAA
jgi:putative transcriptional regulator